MTKEIGDVNSDTKFTFEYKFEEMNKIIQF